MKEDNDYADLGHTSKDGPVEQNQEDIDLLIAFREASGSCQLIFVEAKAYSGDGFQHFGKKQTKSKIDRLNAILKGHRGRDPKIISHFVLMSAYKQRNLASFPSLQGPNGEQVAPIWIELKLPDKRRVVRFPGSRARMSVIDKTNSRK